MILEPGKKDKYHRDILVDKPKLIRAKKWNGKFQREPKGFFLIKVEDGWIKAGRIVKQKMVDVVYGRNACDIFYYLIRRGMISKLDTAAYLGRELTRAEYCLKNKKKYVQE